MINRSIFLKNIIPNVYIPNKKTAKYTKQKLIQPQGVMEKYTIIVEDISNLIGMVD